MAERNTPESDSDLDFYLTENDSGISLIEASVPLMDESLTGQISGALSGALQGLRGAAQIAGEMAGPLSDLSEASQSAGDTSYHSESSYTSQEAEESPFYFDTEKIFDELFAPLREQFLQNFILSKGEIMKEELAALQRCRLFLLF